MPHPVDTHVGQRLKALRLLRGLTQSDIAKALNISFQQIQKYELGRNRISASKIYELAKVLNVPAAYFFEGLDETGDGGPVIDPDSAKLAGKIAQLDEAAQRALTGYVDAFLHLQACTGAAA